MDLLCCYELSSLAHAWEVSVKSLRDAGGDVSASVDGTLLSVSENEPALSLSAAAHQLQQRKKKPENNINKAIMTFQQKKLLLGLVPKVCPA